ncbi:hypothetical protein AAMO2058_000286900 [Amorphochlora amoebiformis]
MDAEANPPRQVLESKKGGQKPKMEPLLDGKDQNRYGEIWKAQFRSKSWTGSKEYAVELTTATFRIQGCEYEIEDIVGASLIDGGFCTHAYPLKACCGCWGKPDRSYTPLRLYTTDSKLAADWVKRINHLARGLPPTTEPVPDRKMLVYINPFSGVGQAPKLFKSVVVTKKSGQVEEEITKIDLDAYEATIIVSGDGLIFEYLTGIMNRSDWPQTIQKPFGVLPGGTGNGLAASLRNSSGEPMTPLGSAMLIAKGKKSPLDLLQFKQSGFPPKYGFLSLTWGFFSDLDLNSEVCRCCGTLRFECYAIQLLCNFKSYKGSVKYIKSIDKPSIAREEKLSAKGIRLLKEAVITSQPGSLPDSKLPEIGEDTKWEEVGADRYSMLLALNTSMQSEDVILAPGAKLDDGFIHLTYLQGHSCCSTLRALLRFEDGSMFKDPNYKRINVERVRIEPDKSTPSLFSLDGEHADDHTSPIDLTVFPSVLTVFTGGGATASR